MFTGIVREIGAVRAIETTGAGSRLTVAASFAGELGEGDSVAVEGACLTASGIGGGGFSADVMNQTLSLTTLGGLAEGDPVNLEPALRAGDPLGGHIVQGHVDGVGEVSAIEDDGFAKRIRVTLPDQLLRYAIDKGSIALDGVSLTIAALGEDWIEVSLIPETLERTNLGEAGAGRKINVECDVIAKHVERLVAPLARKEQA